MTEKRTSDLAFTAESLYGMRPEQTFGGALSFMRRKYTRELAHADVAVVGIPFDTATTNRPGARLGPRGVRAASTVLAWNRPWPWEFNPFDRLAVIDFGDFTFDFGRPAGIPEEIEANALAVLEENVALLSLGGDHFVSYPLLRAHAKKHGPLCLVHFDAHSDTWHDEDGRVDHGTMFFHAAKQGIVTPEHSVQIGIRTVNDDTLGFNTLDARWVHKNGPEAVAEKIKSICGERKVYLTFDIDCLDPCYAPGTGTPVCGGLTTFQAQEIIRNLRGINLVGMDLVEVAPAYDVGEITSLAGASLAYEFLCLYAVNPHVKLKRREAPPAE